MMLWESWACSEGVKPWEDEHKQREEQRGHQSVRCPWRDLSESSLTRVSRREQSTEPRTEVRSSKTETGHDVGIAGKWLGQKACF